MSYRHLVEENAECRIVHKLRNDGHDVEHVDDQQSSATDHLC